MVEEEAYLKAEDVKAILKADEEIKAAAMEDKKAPLNYDTNENSGTEDHANLR